MVAEEERERRSALLCFESELREVVEFEALLSQMEGVGDRTAAVGRVNGGVPVGACK